MQTIRLDIVLGTHTQGMKHTNIVRCIHFSRLNNMHTQGSHGLWKFGENGIRFSRPWKVCENWVGSVKVCEFCGRQSTREKLSAHQSETAFPKTEQFFFFLNCCTKLVLTDRVHWSLATIRVAPLYRMCGRVGYMRVAFPRHIVSIMPGFCVFNVWLEKPAYKHWLRKDGTSNRKAFCTMCKKTIDVISREKELLPVTARVSDFQVLKLAGVEYSGLRWR